MADAPPVTKLVDKIEAHAKSIVSCPCAGRRSEQHHLRLPTCLPREPALGPIASLPS